MKTLRRVLCGFAAIAALLFAVSCDNGSNDSGKKKVTVAEVTFSPEGGQKVAQGTKIALTSKTENADIYYSFTEELTAENYGTVGKLASSVEVTKNCTIYAIAVDPATGKVSKCTSAEYQVTGPDPVTFELTNGDLDTEDGVYANYSTLKLASATEGAEIYYANEEFSAKDYATKAQKYTEVISFAGSTGTKIEIYAVAVKANEAGVTEPSMVKSASYKLVPRYLPASDENTYTLDGNIAAVIKQIGTATSKKDLKSEVEGAEVEYVDVSGIVTMTNGKETNGNIYIQDKDASLIVFNAKLDATQYKPGEYVSVKATKGQLYYGSPEISEYSEIKKDETKNSDFVYYENLTGLTDFSGLETIKLCAIKADAADYTDDWAVISAAETATGKLAHFGYVSLFENDKDETTGLVAPKVKFISLYTKNEKVLPDDKSTIKNTVEKVLASTSQILPGETVSLYTVTPDVTIRYTLDGKAATETSTEYTEPIKLDEANAYTINVLAQKEGYHSAAFSIPVLVLGTNQKLVDFSANDFKDEKGEKLIQENSNSILEDGSNKAVTLKIDDDLTVVLSNGENAKTTFGYYEADKAIRMYNNNEFIIKSNKVISSILFNWKSAPNDASQFIPSAGTFDKEKGWSGVAKTLSFTAKTTLKISSIIVTYDNTGLEAYDGEVVFSAKSGTYAPDSKLTLSVPEGVTDADIWFSIEERLTDSNYNTKGFKYDGSELTLTENVTVYAILVSKDGKKFSSGTSEEYAISLGKASAVDSINDGDEVYLYVSNNVLSSKASSSKLSTAAVTLANEKFDITADMAPLTVKKNGEEYTFTTEIEGKTMYLTCPATGNGLSFADKESDYSVWTLSKVTADGYTGTFNIVSKNGKYTNKKEQKDYKIAIEFYNTWTSYSYDDAYAASSDTKQTPFHLTFYKKD